MNILELQKEARSALPLMPSEIFELWLDERIQALGWPPYGSRWEGILHNQPLSIWKKIHWEKKEIPLSLQIFDKNSQYFIKAIQDGAVGNTNYVTQLTGNSGLRMKSIYKYINEYGTTPNSIIIIKGQQNYILADGCHRMAVLSLLQNSPEDFKKLNAVHSVWMGTLK